MSSVVMTAHPDLSDDPGLGVGGAMAADRREFPAVPTAYSVLLVVIGMAFTLWWYPITDHVSGWMTPHDFWSTYRDAHYVGWGAFGQIYTDGTGLVTLPAIAIILAPVAMLTGAFHMSEGFPYALAQPTSWLVAGPAIMALGSVALFGADALCRRIGMTRTRRLIACFFVLVGLFNLVVLFGHPEDAIAVGLGCYALVAVIDGRGAAAGWFFGAAIAFQPLVVVLVPLAIAAIGMRRAWCILWRAAAPSAALLALPFASAFGATYRAVVVQPNFANIDHHTPWTSLAPTVSGSGQNLLVAAGPMRTLSIAGAVVLAICLRKRLQDPVVLVWACSLAFALRCVTESVMVGYYVWPSLGLASVLLARKKPGIAVSGLLLVGSLTVIADIRFGEWLWWPTCIGTLLFIVAVAAPPLKSGPVDDDHIEVVHSGVSRPTLESGIVSAS
jgi:hypothetical protein